MNVQQLIHATADDADDFLAGISSEKEARSAIREYLESHHPELPPVEQPRVIAAVVAILSGEGFFENSGGTDSPEEAGGGSDDEP